MELLSLVTQSTLSKVVVEYRKTKHSYAKVIEGVVHIRISEYLSPQEQKRHLEELLKKSEKLLEKHQSRIDLFGQAYIKKQVELFTGEVYSFPEEATREAFLKELGGMLRKEYRETLTNRLLALQSEMGGRPITKVRMTGAGTRWGSCSSKGTISISLRTLLLPSHLCEYILVHEVAHLTHMNHSQDFWDHVAETLPDYKKRVKELKKYV